MNLPPNPQRVEWRARRLSSHGEHRAGRLSLKALASASKAHDAASNSEIPAVIAVARRVNSVAVPATFAVAALPSVHPRLVKLERMLDDGQSGFR